MLPINLLLRF